MIQTRLAEDIEDAPRGAGLGVGRSVDHAWQPSEHDRAGAHRARLERDVEHGVEDPPAGHRPCRLAQGEYLGVGGGVTAQLALVVCGRDRLAVAYDHCSDRHVVVLERALGLPQREAHEVFVAWEEVGARAVRERNFSYRMMS